MSLRYRLGQTLSAAESFFLSRSWFPLMRRGFAARNWCYDACRFAGTREFRRIVDVGANVGHVTRDLARFFPSAEIHAFEPIAATYEKLVATIAGNPRLHPHRLALSDAPGEAHLQLHEASELNSLHFQAAAAGGGRERIDITTLDRFCAQHGIADIDLLKVDAQGFDLNVLQGSSALLGAERVPFIVAEGSFTPGDTTNQYFAPLHAFLTDRGYRVSGIYDQLNYGPRWEYLGCFNLLWTHPAARERRFPSSGAAGRGAA
jgi:FkbM family methyltransferase